MKKLFKILVAETVITRNWYWVEAADEAEAKELAESGETFKEEEVDEFGEVSSRTPLGQMHEIEALDDDRNPQPHTGFRIFDDASAAYAFLEGIELVNDSSLQAWINDSQPCVVWINDDDARDDLEEAE